MSSFSGLSVALSSLIAQRRALDVAGQNIANANTLGYTRQRVGMQSVEALSAPSMHSAGLVAGHGVRLTSIERIGDIFLDARLRSATSAAFSQGARAAALSLVESTLTEPTDDGLAATLQKFWAAWEDVGNHPEDVAARKVLIGTAEAAVSQISAGYRAIETQWTQARNDVRTLATEVNTTAQGVADLNEKIRSILVSGGSANELIDQRSLLVTKLAGLVGASGREREDGTLDVMVAGNALVRGVQAKEIQVVGSMLMGEATADPPTGDQVRLVWAADPTVQLGLQGGTMASYLSDLQPASEGGVLATVINSWNEIATSLASTVNAVHATGYTAAGDAGGEFFHLDGSLPPAVGLSVTATAADVAAAAAGAGALDGSVAAEIAQLAGASGGPDSLWRDLVVDIGVRARTAEQRATVTEAARASAENLQLAQASVDLDEETVNMLAYQRAYEGAARVLTVIDEMLDVLINRTGVVGR